MRYLFFDIECCDGQHICEFGYVITDEKFNVIEKNDLVINPEKPFNLAGPRMEARVKLFYSEEEYRSGLTFLQYYKKIKQLIETKNQIVVGHSLLNDAGFLRKACERYKLEPINFDFYDSQKIYAEYFKSKSEVSLENAIITFNVEQKGHLHKSDDDAETTMLFVKKMCDSLDCNLHELVELCPSSQGYSKGFYIGYTESSLPKILEYAKSSPDRISQSKKAKTFMQIASTEQYDKVVSFATGILKYHFAEMLTLAKYLKGKKYTFTNKVSESNIFIKFDEFYEDGNLKECMRFKSAIMNIEEGKEMIINDFDSFVGSLGLTLDKIMELPFPSEEDFNDSLSREADIRKHKSITYTESEGGISLGELLRAQGFNLDKLKKVSNSKIV